MSPTGHLAVGFTAQKFAPQIPLAVFLIAAYAIDLLYFLFLAIGLDSMRFDPWSHSLFMAVIWSATAGFLAMLIGRKQLRGGSRIRAGLTLAAVVFSHWILDFIVWSNLPLFFDQTRTVGLGLYDRLGFSLIGFQLNSGALIATAVELGLLALGLASYFRSRTRSRHETTRQSQGNVRPNA